MTHNTRERIEEKLAGKVVICDGLYTSKVGTILGTGSSRRSIKLLVDGLERYEPDYALLHVTEDNEQAIILLLSHHQELQKAREEERDKILRNILKWSDTATVMETTGKEGAKRATKKLREHLYGSYHFLYQALRIDQSELDQPTETLTTQCSQCGRTDIKGEMYHSDTFPVTWKCKICILGKQSPTNITSE